MSERNMYYNNENACMWEHHVLHISSTKRLEVLDVKVAWQHHVLHIREVKVANQRRMYDSKWQSQQRKWPNSYYTSYCGLNGFTSMQPLCMLASSVPTGGICKLLLIRILPLNESFRVVGITHTREQPHVAVQVHKVVGPAGQQPVPLPAVDEVEGRPVAFATGCTRDLHIEKNSKDQPWDCHSKHKRLGQHCRQWTAVASPEKSTQWPVSLAKTASTIRKG